MSSQIVLSRRQEEIPRVPNWRRGAALAIDLGLAFVVSALAGNLAWLLFMPLWWIARVAVVANRKGQSLGRWAFDMRVIEMRYGATPNLMELTKRESVTGFGGLLILIGLQNWNTLPLALMILVLPLLVDCGFAWADPEFRQAGHDRLANTLVIQTRRGYSLDLKLKWLFAQLGKRMK